MLTDLEKKAALTISEQNMLDSVNQIVVGFSGGADSVSLLHFLDNFIKKNELNIKIMPVHINHGLRGEEAERDEKFAKDFCAKIGLDLIIRRIDAKKIASENKISTEEAGRMMRYNIFGDYALNSNSKIAVAHTLSDSCETIIFNLVRGTGLKGLCGIPPVRGNIIRPLVGVTRNEVEEYCRINNLKYVDDSTNFGREYTRNKIRLDVIPIFKKINPNFEKSVERMILNLSLEQDYLENISSNLLKTSKTEIGYNITDIKNSHTAVKHRVLSKIFSIFSNKLAERKHIEILENIVKKGSGGVSVGKNMELICKNNILFATESSNIHIKRNEFCWKAKMYFDENILTDTQINIIIKIVSAQDYKKIQKINKLNNIWFLDYDKLPAECYFRYRNGGDKFCLSKRNVTKTVKKLFNEYKIPAKARSKILLLAHNSDIIWIENIGVAQNYVLSKNTKKIAVLKIEEIF